MNATAQPASAPSKYAVGLGARFSPPIAVGRSASQLNGPADSRACPLTSDAVTAGAERARSESVAKRSVLAASRSADIIFSSLRGPDTGLPNTVEEGCPGDIGAGTQPRSCGRPSGYTQFHPGCTAVSRTLMPGRGGPGRQQQPPGGLAAHTQLEVGVGQMPLHRTHAQRQGLGDLAV